MPIILNEKKLAKEIIEKGEVGDKPSSTLFLLSKYYAQVEGLKTREIQEKLNSFMLKNFKGYNSAKWEQLIEDYAKKGCKKVKQKNYQYSLKEFDYVSISKTEIEKIEMVDDIKYQKLLFTMLCYAKYHNLCSDNNNGWINTDIRELYKTARVTVHYSKDKFLYLNDLERVGLIEFSKKNYNLNMRITFIDDNEPFLQISDFRELGYEYEAFTNNIGFTRCSECNRLIKKKSKSDRSTKYCKDCAKKIQYEQKKAWDQKNR